MSRTVLVTDAARGSSIAIIRSLGRRGWRVIGADPRATAAGRWSRWTAGWLTYPDPRIAPTAAVDTLLDAVRRERVDLLFPVTDDVIMPLLHRRADVEATAAVALAPTGAVLRAADKAAINDLAVECGVPTPASRLWQPGQPLPDLGWPLVVKPVRSRTIGAAGGIVAHDVRYAADRDELERLLAESPGPVLLQQYVAGEGHGVEVLARGGEIVVAFQHRRIREYPPSGGSSACRVAVAVDPTLLEGSARLLRALRWEGLAMVEFKVGAAGHHLMEINGRVWGSLPLAVAAGVDFPWLAAAVHLGEPLGTIGEARLGTRSRNVELELRWAAAVLAGHRASPNGSARPTRRDALRTVIRLAHPRDGYDVLDRRDPIPGVVDAARAVGRTARRSLGR